MGNKQKNINKELKKVAIKKSDKDSSHVMNVVMISVAIILCMAIIAAAAVLIVSGVKDKYGDPEDIVSFQSKHYEVDNAMLTYYYTQNFYSFYQSNYVTLVYYYGFDASQPLSSQYYDQDSGTTWHQYFLESAANTAMQNLYLAEAAYDAGLKLDDADYKEIDKAIDSIKEDATEKGMELDAYIEYLYGDTTEEAIRDALELAKLANKQTEALRDSFGVTTEDCETYYSENNTEFDMVDYRSYDITATVTDDMTDDEKEDAYSVAEAAANEIAAATNEEEFIAKLYAYMQNENTTAETPVEDSTLLTNAQDAKTEEATYTEDDEKSTWLFDSERKAGDTTVISSTEGTYTVIYLTTTAYRDESNTVNVRHILVKSSEDDDDETKEAAKATADELQAAWDASDKTEDTFMELADKYNEDSSSLYEDVKQGDMVTEFNDWIFDESRKTGDCEMVETEYGYHLIYFVDKGLPVWEATAKSSIEDTKLSDKMTEYQETYTVDYDSNKVLKIADYNVYQVPEETTEDTEDTSIDTAVDTSEYTTVDTTEDTTVDTAEDTTVDTTEVSDTAEDTVAA